MLSLIDKFFFLRFPSQFSILEFPYEFNCRFLGVKLKVMPSFTVIRFLSLSVFNLGELVSVYSLMVGGIDFRYREKVVMLLLGFIKNLLFKD